MNTTRQATRLIMRTRLLSLLGAIALLGCNRITGPDRPNGVPPIHSLDYPASVVPSGYQLPVAGQPGVAEAGVRLTNTGTAPATIEYGACSVAIWLYRDDMPGAPPVWQSRLPEQLFCADIALIKTLAPGESFGLNGATLDARELGLPNGRYLVRVAVKHSASGAPMTTQLVVLDAGTIALVH